MKITARQEAVKGLSWKEVTAKVEGWYQPITDGNIIPDHLIYFRGQSYVIITGTSVQILLKDVWEKHQPEARFHPVEVIEIIHNGRKK